MIIANCINIRCSTIESQHRNGMISGACAANQIAVLQDIVEDFTKTMTIKHPSFDVGDFVKKCDVGNEKLLAHRLRNRL